jgi:neutral ceramidase
VTLFGNGCCGNLCAIDVYDPERDDRGHEWAAHMGEVLADDVLQALPHGERLTDPVMDHRSNVIPMPIRHISDDLLAWAKGYLDRPDAADNFAERCYAEMAHELLEMQRNEPLVATEVAAYRLGDYAVVTLPGEIFVEFGLDIKLKSPARRTFVVELANGIVGYVPTKRAFEGGGYEQRTATSSKLDPVAGEMLVAVGRALLDSMFR